KALGELAGDGLDFDSNLRGGKPRGGLAEVVLRARRGVARRIACATSTRSPGGSPSARQSHHYPTLWRRGERSWLAPPRDTITYSSAPAVRAACALRWSARSNTGFFSASVWGFLLEQGVYRTGRQLRSRIYG